jgi:protein SCO1/2
VDRNSSRHSESAARPEDLLKTFGASVFVLLVGLGVIFDATDRGSGFTTEALRRTEVAREPRQIPNFLLLDLDGKKDSLRRRLAADNRVRIIDFIYMRCRSVCSSLGSVYQQLQQRILERGLQGQVSLLSISFDPAHDDAAALQDYAARMRLSPAVWEAVSLASASDRQRLLDSFGIMVVPAPMGGFEHNAALHIVDARARLVRITDYDALDQALDAALAAKR